MIALISIFAIVFLTGCYIEKNNYLHVRSDNIRSFMKVFSKIFALFPCITSFVFLIDAFRRIYKVEKSAFIFSTMKISAHIICFFLIVVTGIVLVCCFSIGKTNYTAELLTAISVVLSEVPLIIIVYSIM